MKSRYRSPSPGDGLTVTAVAYRWGFRSSSRFAAGMTRSGAFTWKTHLDRRYEGYRLGLKVAPETDAPEDVATELASQVLHGLRRAGLIGAG